MHEVSVCRKIVRRLKCTIVITRYPSSVVVNFSHLQLLLWNYWSEFNETWQEARSQRPLPSLLFRADQKNKMAVLASDWLRHFLLFIRNFWTEFNETWQEARSQRPLPSLCFFGSIGKNKMAALPLIGWDIFDFSETAERNSTKLDRKQDLNVLYQVCDFGPIGKTRWPPHFWLAETFWTSYLKQLTRIKRKLIGSKVSTSSNEFLFFMPMSIQKWPPWPICQKGGTLYSGARYVVLWASSPSYACVVCKGK